MYIVTVSGAVGNVEAFVWQHNKLEDAELVAYRLCSKYNVKVIVSKAVITCELKLDVNRHKEE